LKADGSAAKTEFEFSNTKQVIAGEGLDTGLWRIVVRSKRCSPGFLAPRLTLGWQCCETTSAGIRSTTERLHQLFIKLMILE
jgi:hypothetical protein